MSGLEKQQRLAALRASIADIERRPALAEARAVPRQDEVGFPVLAGGMLQEVFTDERRNGGAALGFALAQARGLLTPVRQAVLYLQMLAEAQEMGLPYGPGLASFGFDPDALVLIRPANITELLWAAEEALACRAVAAVIADVAGQPKILDFTASRRLSLRADASGATLLFLRYGAWREASAAQLRWHLQPALSAEMEFDARAPGQTRWRARLEKGVIAGRQDQEWLLEWRQNGFESITNPKPDADGLTGGAAVPESLPAQLGHRLLQTA
jgi:protein ImuA